MSTPNGIPAVHFIHLRTTSLTGKNAGKNSEKGGGTIAYRQIASAETDKDVYLFYVSHVNPKDNFNAKIGREVSRGRLLNPRNRDDIQHAVVAAGADHDTVHAAIMSAYATYEEERQAAYIASLKKQVA